MNPRVFLVHGFNVRDNGARTVDRLAPFFKARGYQPEQFDYGWVGLLGVRFFNGSRAEKLAKRVSPGDIGVGHSNGCAVLHLATHAGAPFRHLTYVNPALDKDAAPGPLLERCDVWYSPSDTSVWLAKWLPWHTWGEMGRIGYFGSDPRMHNHDKEFGYAVSSPGHSDVFDDFRLPYFGPLIADAAPAGVRRHG